jgi:hypothetical protein
MEDAIAFLNENITSEEFVAYAAFDGSFIHALLAPTSLVVNPDREDLLQWQNNAYAQWGIAYEYSPTGSLIEPPPRGTGSITLDKGKQLIFARSFQGRIGEKHYCEILQEFVHVFDLHLLEERSAYCRLDKRGDIEDMIRVIKIAGSDTASSGTIVTFKRSLLDEYLAIADLAIVRTFDFTRCKPNQFAGWRPGIDSKNTTDNDLFYRMHIEPGCASYMRGCQIAFPTVSRESVHAKFTKWHQESQEYATFIAEDLRHGVVAEISCAPGKTANYFVKSDLPFEVSPAFFRSEVLTKYKADSEKYTLEGRSIFCRGAWSLKSYDVNSAGQVHAYLVDLRNLPYEEQLYWKSFNEEPKAKISERAFLADFMGSWDQGYDPLDSLKEKARELHDKRVPWWTLRSEKLLRQVNYPVTSSADEWANEILQLDQLLVEGFEERWLRKRAEMCGRTPDQDSRSLRLIEECIMANGTAEADAKKTTAPLRRLHDLRSKVKGHASGQEAVKIRRQALSEHGDFNKHFRHLCAECDAAIGEIASVLISVA